MSFERGSGGCGAALEAREFAAGWLGTAFGVGRATWYIGGACRGMGFGAWRYWAWACIGSVGDWRAGWYCPGCCGGAPPPSADQAAGGACVCIGCATI